MDGRFEVREGPAVRSGGGYYFHGPVRQDGLRYEGVLAVGTCAACANEYSLTGPFCVGCAGTGVRGWGPWQDAMECVGAGAVCMNVYVRACVCMCACVVRASIDLCGRARMRGCERV